MKFRYILPIAALALMATACSDDEPAGNPVIGYESPATKACFGDNIPFTVHVSDADVALSTLKAQLFFGEEMVQEQVIRTKENNTDYSGEIYVPYYANIPDGTATLRFVLQNINKTVTVEEYPVAITHPDYPYLTLVADGNEYRMEPQGNGLYSVTASFPQKIKATIVAPKTGENGNELVFGYESNAVVVGAEGQIPFSNASAGRYTVSFDTRTFEAAPFVVLKVNDTEMTGIDDNTARVDLSLMQGQAITFDGIAGISEYWLDPDWFATDADGKVTFAAASGSYRIIADQKLKYFRVQALASGAPASLGADATGSIWVIGENFGKPSLANTTGWVTENSVCMAPIGNKKFRMTLVGGQQISTGSINFKFFGGALSWDNEFDHTTLTSTSSVVLIGDGNGHDKGNLYLAEGSSLKEGVTYVFTIDLSAGNNAGVLSVEEK